MKIKKMYQGQAPDNKILNTKSNSQTDTYSCSFLLDYCHPIGQVIMTVDGSFDPNVSYGGSWTQISSDAYLKIVTSGGGNLGGTSSNHKIPTSSLPAHSHSGSTSTNGSHSHITSRRTTTYGSGMQSNWRSISAPDSVSADYTQTSYTESAGDHSHSFTTGNTGDGNAYYPYYLGIYAWTRVA